MGQRTSRRLAGLIGLASLYELGLGKSAHGQPGCDAPTENDWLTHAPPSADGKAVDASLIHPVTSDLGRAITMLSGRAVVALAQADVVAFVNTALDARPLRPYLVRAVFPTAKPTLSVRWVGGNLLVSAFGLGCAPFVKHPIIVFLYRVPTGVTVAASAAL